MRAAIVLGLSLAACGDAPERTESRPSSPAAIAEATDDTPSVDDAPPGPDDVQAARRERLAKDVLLARRVREHSVTTLESLSARLLVAGLDVVALRSRGESLTGTVSDLEVDDARSRTDLEIRAEDRGASLYRVRVSADAVVDGQHSVEGVAWLEGVHGGVGAVIVTGAGELLVGIAEYPGAEIRGDADDEAASILGRLLARRARPDALDRLTWWTETTFRDDVTLVEERAGAGSFWSDEARRERLWAEACRRVSE
jgi:hypothetical protein